MQEGRYSDALPLLNTLISHDPHEAAIWFSRGLAHYFLRQFDDAIHDLTQAIEKGERSADVYYVRGNCLAHLGKLDNALNDYNEAITLQPSALYFQERAKLYDALHNSQEALSDFSTAIALTPDDGTLYYGRAQIRNQFSDTEAMLDDVTVAIEKGYQRPNVYITQAQIYVTLRDYQKSIEAYSAAIGLDKRLVEAFIGRGRSYVALKQTEQALSDFNQALKIEPSNEGARLSRGTLYLNSDDPQDHIAARRDFGELLKGDNPPIVAYYLRALAYIKLNKPDRAEADLWSFVTHGSVQGTMEHLANAWLIVVLALQDKWDDVVDQVNMAREFFPNLATIDDIATRAEFTSEQKMLYVKAWGIPY